MIEFKKIRWKNFLSTGDKFTEIQLNRTSSTLIVGENGAGKSTILDALTFGLFGKPFRKINKPQLVNTVNEKDCVIEIEFSIGKREYLVRRAIKPNKFEVYIDGKMLDQDSKIRDSQIYLEENILKLNFKSFTQTVILGSATFVPFMQLNANDRRDIIEDILDIKIFSAMNEILKTKSTLLKDELFENEKERELQDYKIDLQERNIQQLNEDKSASIKQNKTKIKDKRLQQKKILSENEEYDSQLNTLALSIGDEVKAVTKNKKLEKLDTQLHNNISKIEGDINWFENKDVCPSCQQDIEDEHKHEIISSKNTKKEEIESALLDLQKELDSTQERIQEIETIKKEILELNNKKSSNMNTFSFIQDSIDEIEKEIEDAENNNDNMNSLEEELKELRKLAKDLDSKRRELVDTRNYYNVASQFLKDTGVKTSIVKYYLPIMNKLINKYLQEMDFYINFTLDEKFSENIKSRARENFTYPSFSEGEKMRIDLALLFTWREIARMKNSVNTNLLILDEVFDSSLDATGTDEFLKLLNTLGGNNVFVISHKGDILYDKFHSVVRFEKVKGFSRIGQNT
jgi:DNA repair exonuclease SbcCD ATPase subunit